MASQLDILNDELCPQCEADDADFYNGLAIGEICDDCKAFNEAIDEALLESTAWQIAKDSGYSNVGFALPEAITIVKYREIRIETKGA